MEHRSALYSLSFAFEYRKMPHYKERFKVLILQVSQCSKSGQLIPLFTQTSLRKRFKQKLFFNWPQLKAPTRAPVLQTGAPGFTLKLFILNLSTSTRGLVLQTGALVLSRLTCSRFIFGATVPNGGPIFGVSALQRLRGVVFKLPLSLRPYLFTYLEPKRPCAITLHSPSLSHTHLALT